MSISKPYGMVTRHTGGGTGGDDGTVEASVSDNVDLNGGVATRVVDGAGVDLLDRHCVWCYLILM